MDTPRRAKFMIAGRAGALFVALVVLLLFVLPATRTGSVSTQAQPEPRPPEEMREGARGRMPSEGMYMPQAGQRMAGRGAEKAEAPTPSEFAGDPFEPSRPNPFQAGAGVEIEAIETIKTRITRYGPDWQQMPLASRVGLIATKRPPELEAEAAPKPKEKKFMRISSILWMAGRPLAIYEMAGGETGSIQPGDIIDNWLAQQIGQDYALMKHIVSGETRRVPLKTK